MRRTILAALVSTMTIATTSAVPGVAHAQDAAPKPADAFAGPPGRRSSFILGIDNVLGYTSEGFTSGGGVVDDKGFFAGYLGPRFGFDAVSESGLTFGTGAQLWRIHPKGADDDITIFTLAPRIGYMAPLAGILGVWVRGGPYMLYAHAKNDGELYMAVRLEGFFVLSVAPHMGVMLGPSVDIGFLTSRSQGDNDHKWKAQDMLVGLFAEL